MAAGRDRDINYIDSIAQGRVWSGQDAIANGLVDKIGNLNDAVSCAARLAKVSDYGIREYPETRSLIDEIMGKNKPGPSALIKEQIGEDYYKVYKQLIQIREMGESVQARLPFEFVIR